MTRLQLRAAFEEREWCKKGIVKCSDSILLSVAVFTCVPPHSLDEDVEAKSVVGVVLEAPEPVREEVPQEGRKM